MPPLRVRLDADHPEGPPSFPWRGWGWSAAPSKLERGRAPAGRKFVAVGASPRVGVKLDSTPAGSNACWVLSPWVSPTAIQVEALRASRSQTASRYASFSEVIWSLDFEVWSFHRYFRRDEFTARHCSGRRSRRLPTLDRLRVKLRASTRFQPGWRNYSFNRPAAQRVPRDTSLRKLSSRHTSSEWP